MVGRPAFPGSWPSGLVMAEGLLGCPSAVALACALASPPCAACLKVWFMRCSRAVSLSSGMLRRVFSMASAAPSWSVTGVGSGIGAMAPGPCASPLVQRSTFPVAADDHVPVSLDLNSYLVQVEGHGDAAPVEGGG
jgi:hypothetical protein